MNDRKINVVFYLKFTIKCGTRGKPLVFFVHVHNENRMKLNIHSLIKEG
jgi:hypothetical protein